MAYIHLRDVQLAFGGAALLDHTHFTLERGERVCLIGRNGEGKSTLLKLIEGTIKPDQGEVIIQNGLRIAMLTQDVPMDSGRVGDIVAEGAGKVAQVLKEYHLAQQACSAGDSNACERMGDLQHQLDQMDGWSLENEVSLILSKMGLDPNSHLEDLSGGRKRRVLLARALLSKPDILLLDEPTNHLDVESIEWLEKFLLDQNQLTLLFISHDRSFVDTLSTRIVELDRGILRSFDGNYSRYLTLKAQQLEAEEKQNALFDKKLAEEEAWIRQGIKARRTRNEGRVRALKALREESKARRFQQGKANMAMQEAQRSGKLVFEINNLSVEYDGQKLINDFSSVVMRGDRIGLVGDNGVGKTTLIKAILGEIQHTGEVRVGTQLEVAYFDQLRNQLDLEKSVADNVSEGSDYVDINGQRRHILGYLQEFLFAPERARTPVKALSGGERNRVLLAKLLLKPSNLIIMDEPTNDLDMVTLELLEELLSEYKGTLLLISHDRAFMDNVVTSTWVFDGKGNINEYVGGYQDYLMQRPQIEKPTKKNIVKNEIVTAEKTSTTEKNIKKKLSYKEQRELELLPKEIEQLESEQAKLQEQLADGSWFTTDIAAATQASERLAEIELLLLEKLERWTELEG